MADIDAKALKTEIQKQKSDLKKKNDRITKLLAEVETLKSDVISIQNSLADNEKLYRMVETADVMNKINDSILEDKTITIKDMEELESLIKDGKLRQMLESAKAENSNTAIKVDTNINV